MPPTAPLHPWARPLKPWSRVHIDYAGPFEGKMFLLIVDAYSKWLEVHTTSLSTSTITIKLLQKSFVSLGLPEVVVSDNGTTFTSQEFADFMKNKGIRHVFTTVPSVIKRVSREGSTDTQGRSDLNRWKPVSLSFYSTIGSHHTVP